MTKPKQDRERCNCCGCYLGFAMGPECDGDLVCNNSNCKSNTSDWRSNFEPKILPNLTHSED